MDRVKTGWAECEQRVGRLDRMPTQDEQSVHMVGREWAQGGQRLCRIRTCWAGWAE